MNRYNESESSINKEEEGEVEEEEEIINNDCDETFELKEDLITDQNSLSYLSEFMAFPISEKISQYSQNNNIRFLRNPITSDTIFHYLCINDENYPLIKIMKPTLIECESKNNTGFSLFHISIKNKSYKIAEYLIEKGANINTKDYMNNTPLHTAISQGDILSIHLLIINNAKYNLINNQNETPMDIAKKNYNESYVKYLQDFIYLAKNNISSLNSNTNITNTNMKSYKNKSLYNISNNCSLDTKNETNNISLNVYMKKIILKSKSPNNRNIKYNKTTNISQYKLNRTPDNKGHENCITMPPYEIIDKSGCYTKRNTKPNLKRKTNYITQYEQDIEKNLRNYGNNSNKETKRTKTYKMIDGMVSETTSNVNINQFKFDTRDELEEDNIVTPNISGNIFPYQLSLIKNNKNNNIKSNNCKINQNLKKEISAKDQLIQFLKKIGMQNYSNILISEGFDDINLITKQMNENFPMTDETMKEIGINLAGDRAKILIRIQEMSNGFSFDLPFEQVYFGNNKSIEKWLDKLNMGKYYDNFIINGYSSIELLLIQMASRFKINEKILEKDLNINDEEDRNIILKDLSQNSRKYIGELIKKTTVERSFSKMVPNKTSNCVII